MPRESIATTVWSCVSGFSPVFAASGIVTATPCWSIGAISIMMMSSTSMTSTSGVTLMSALRILWLPRSIAIAEFPYLEIWNLGIW